MPFTLTIKERGHSWAGSPPVTSTHGTRAEAEALGVYYLVASKAKGRCRST